LTVQGREILRGSPVVVLVSGGRGNLTTIQKQITGGSSPTYLYRVFTYYDTGNLKTTTDWGTTSSGGSNVTTYNYSTNSFSSENTTLSCGNSFVTSLSEPLSLTRSFTWDCFGGVQTSITDENTQMWTSYYNQTSSYGSPDPDYWRPYATTDPLLNPTKLTYSSTVSESKLEFNSNNSIVDQRTTVDGLGRLILGQAEQTPTSTTYDTNQNDYDAFGRISKRKQ
jgi:hypothetical protein